MLAPSRSSLNSTSRLIVYALVVFSVFLIGLSILAQQSPNTLSSPQKPDIPPPNSSPALSSILEKHSSLSAEHYLKYITRPLVKVDDQEFNLYGALKWTLPKTEENRTWSKPLGEQLCIIDLDNRSFNKSGHLWGNATMSWEKPVHGLSLGVLNHWLYAKIHGYKYYYIHIDESPDRRNSWKKPTIISKILKKHQTCIYLDSDAVFNHLDLPFEWLMNYWSISPTTNSLSLAYDPALAHNNDRFGKTYLNTGFIISQNNPKTFEIMDAWRECPDEGGKHPNCTEFRKSYAGGPTDQGGFGTYIRYDYPEDIRGLPCGEANGYTQSGTECTGEFIQHLWTGKDKWIKLVVGRQMPGDLLEIFHRRFLGEREGFWWREKELLASS